MKTARARHYRGITTIETIVAFTLLTTVMTCSVTLIVRNGHLLSSHRQYRLALDELSNQIERLTALPPAELSDALKQLAPSPFTSTRLTGVALQGELEPAEVGQRLTLRLAWGESHHRAPPISMAAWIMPSDRSSERPEPKGR